MSITKSTGRTPNSDKMNPIQLIRILLSQRLGNENLAKPGRLSNENLAKPGRLSNENLPNPNQINDWDTHFV
uniref:Uncharacterized protein n=1 Tax=Globodera rostochiensis TaxID=31243 RepID=A0A914HUP6_GLORO